MLVDAYLINKMLNSIKSNPTYENVAKSTLRTYIDEIGLVIISIMISIIFTFMSNVQIYSIGNSILVVILGTSVGTAKKIAQSEKYGKFSNILKYFMGIIILLIGLYMLYLGF